jgi:pimeloyl-ACP methyl ester carboxylesterase
MGASCLAALAVLVLVLGLGFGVGLLAVTPANAAGEPPPAADGKAYGAELEGFDYADPVARFDFESQRQSLHMAYLDVASKGPANGRTVVLLHGKNFCAGTWAATIAALTAAGYRAVAPDQIGFCKSSKPDAYQYSFQQLAANTRALLHRLQIEKFTLLGHSMGGMLATRYALTYPEDVEQLVLVNPLGFEDLESEGRAVSERGRLVRE